MIVLRTTHPVGPALPWAVNRYHRLCEFRRTVVALDPTKSVDTLLTTLASLVSPAGTRSVHVDVSRHGLTLRYDARRGVGEDALDTDESLADAVCEALDTCPAVLMYEHM